MNAYIERFVQSIQQECLDKFIAFGQEHFDLLNREYVEHYHHERPHQAKGNSTLSAEPKLADAYDLDGQIACYGRLGNVLRHYYRRAAA
jgi:putative transposase